MAYQALYRKYRPSNFDEVVGQKHIIQTLKNAVVQDRIGHAYLFCGPRGTGKTSIAKIFAKMLNCEDENNKPCGKCLNCQMVQNGSHPDIIEIDAASNNGVDEVRNLIDKVKYAPMQGKYKVYIIDEVHMMTSQAFNALLKTIEEPPTHVIFIMATTEPNKVIPTIISRCQRFDFNKVSDADIIKRISIVCQKENIEIDPEAVSLIAQLADGGMRDSLSILDQCVAYCISKISVDDVRQIYGVLTTKDIGFLFSHLYHKEIEELIRQLQEYSDHGIDLKRLTSDFIKLLKDSIILDHSENSSLVDEEKKKVIQEFLLNSPTSFRFQLLDGLMDVYNKYNYASNILDYLQTTLLKVISISYDKNNDIFPKTNMNTQTKNIQITEKLSNLSYEKQYEISGKTEKEAKKDDKQGVLEENPIYDVSRETLNDSDNQDSKIILNDEYVLQLVVGADKSMKIKDIEKMKKNDQYLSDLSYAKFANSLKNSNLFVSGSNYIVVALRSKLEAKAINELQLSAGYESYLNILLEEEKTIFAIDITQRDKVIKEFKERQSTNSLPDPADVIIHKNKNKQEREKTGEEQIREMFPNVEIIED